MTEEKVITTETPFVIFEDNPIGRMKKEIWDASDAEIDVILSKYGVPAPVHRHFVI